MGKVYARDIGSLDGLITNATNLANGNVSYTYIDMLRDGYSHLTLEHIISNTTLTIEACNVGADPYFGQTISGVASATDGTGATLTASQLASLFSSDDDLNGIQVRIIQDDTTQGNLGLVREVIDYVGATGVMTLSSALGATTSGVTKFRLEDSSSKWARRVTDPSGNHWRDVTTLLTGSASHTTSGVWILDTDIAFERLRIKRVTTNSSNSCVLRSTRGR